ncbi:MAG TPA: hypothetical protein VIH90_02815 [Candidatus Saccharimonadales bacterium]
MSRRPELNGVEELPGFVSDTETVLASAIVENPFATSEFWKRVIEFAASDRFISPQRLVHDIVIDAIKSDARFPLLTRRVRRSIEFDDAERFSQTFFPDVIDPDLPEEERRIAEIEQASESMEQRRHYITEGE